MKHAIIQLIKKTVQVLIIKFDLNKSKFRF